MKAEMKAVVASIVVIALALTAVSGVTYSWFSDEETADITVKTGNITISDFKLNVEILDGSTVKYSKNNIALVDGKYTIDLSTTPLVPGYIINVAVPEITIAHDIDINYYETCSISEDLKDNFTVTGVQKTAIQYLASNTEDGKSTVNGHTIALAFYAENEDKGKTGSITLTFNAAQVNKPIDAGVSTTVPNNEETKLVISTGASSSTGSSTGTATVSIPASTSTSVVGTTATVVEATAETAKYYATVANANVISGIVLTGTDSNGEKMTDYLKDEKVTLTFVLDGKYCDDSGKLLSGVVIFHENAEFTADATGESIDATYNATLDRTTITVVTTQGFSPYFVATVEAKIGNAYYSTFTSAYNALTENATIELVADAAYDSVMKVEKSFSVNLNNHQLDLKTVTVKDSKSLSISGGKLTADNSPSLYYETCIDVEKGASITLNKVEYTAKNGSALYPHGDAAAVNVIESTVETLNGAYGVGTNASTKDNFYVSIIITNSHITAKTSESNNYDSTAVMINVPGTLTITNSHLTADRQCLFVRAGDATVSGTEFIYTNAYAGTSENQREGDWGTGNEASTAVIVVGDTSIGSSYPADAILKLTNVTVKNDSNAKTLVVSQEAGKGQTAQYTSAVILSGTNTGVLDSVYFHAFNKDKGTNGTWSLVNKTDDVKDKTAFVTTTDGEFKTSVVAAETGDNTVGYYASLNDAFTNVKTGGTVTLLSDITTGTVTTDAIQNKNTAVYDYLTVNKKVTLNLNGKNITFLGYGLRVNTGGDFTITGEGTITGGSYKVADYENLPLVARGGKVTIESGTFVSKSCAECIYAGKEHGTQIIINGGTFKSDESSNKAWGYLLNVSNSGNINSIIVNGGDFYDYSPADGDDHLEGSILVSNATVSNPVTKDGHSVYTVTQKSDVFN